MIKVLVFDIDPIKVAKIAASFTLGDGTSLVTTCTNPLITLRKILSEETDILVFAANCELTKDLPFRLVVESLALGKAPTLSLLLNQESNKAGTVTSFSTLTNVPESVDKKTVESAIAFASSSKDNAAEKKSSANLSLAVVNKQISVIMSDFADVFIPMIEESLIVGGKAIRENFYVKQTDEASGDISSIVTVNAPGLLGCIAISFDSKLFLKIASNFMNTTITSLEEDGRDVITEIFVSCINKLRKKLKTKDINLDNSLPVCFSGKGHKITHLSGSKTICFKFKMNDSIISIEYSIAAKLA